MIKQNVLPNQSTEMNTVLLPPVVGESFRIHSDELIKILISLSGKKQIKAACVRDNAGQVG